MQKPPHILSLFITKKTMNWNVYVIVFYQIHSLMILYKHFYPKFCLMLKPNSRIWRCAFTLVMVRQASIKIIRTLPICVITFQTMGFMPGGTSLLRVMVKVPAVELVALLSRKWPGKVFRGPITTVKKMIEFCEANIEGIKFFNVSEANISQHADEFKLK